MDTASQDLSENRQGELRITMIFVTALAAFFVGLRFYARGMKSVPYGWDDWMILFALPWLILLMALGLMMIHFGLGTHQLGLTVPQLVNFGKTLLAFECVYIFTAAVVKTSLLLMYVRAFDIRRIRIASIILESTVIAWAVAIIVLCIFQCTPIAKAWNPTIPGTCIDLRGSFIGNAVPNIATDVLILALPIHTLWKLDTSFALKIQLSFVFLLGSFVVFTAIYRFTTLFAFNQLDTTWTLATSCAWVVVEVASGVISVCLPTLGPLLACGAWRERSKAMRSGSGLNSTDKSASLPTKMYAVEDMEIGRGGGGFERIESSKDEDLAAMAESLNSGGRQLHTMPEEVESFEMGRRMPIMNEREVGMVPVDEIRPSSGRGLAPPPRRSMVKRY